MAHEWPQNEWPKMAVEWPKKAPMNHGGFLESKNPLLQIVRKSLCHCFAVSASLPEAPAQQLELSTSARLPPHPAQPASHSHRLLEGSLARSKAREVVNKTCAVLLHTISEALQGEGEQGRGAHLTFCGESKHTAMGGLFEDLPPPSDASPGATSSERTSSAAPARGGWSVGSSRMAPPSLMQPRQPLKPAFAPTAIRRAQAQSQAHSLSQSQNTGQKASVPSPAEQASPGVPPASDSHYPVATTPASPLTSFRPAGQHPRVWVSAWYTAGSPQWSSPGRGLGGGGRRVRPSAAE